MSVQRATVAPVIRWAGRLCAVPLIALVIASYIGIQTAPLFKGPPTETLRHGAFLLAVFGLAVGWMWDIAGAILVLGGMAIVYGLNIPLIRLCLAAATRYLSSPESFGLLVRSYPNPVGK